MENRWSSRRDIKLLIDICVNAGDEELFLSCHSRDVGLGGVFVASDYAFDQHNRDVRLIFSLDSGFGEKKYTLPAQIVRVEDKGIGLKFNRYDTNAFRCLQHILSDSQ